MASQQDDCVSPPPNTSSNPRFRPRRSSPSSSQCRSSPPSSQHPSSPPKHGPLQRSTRVDYRNRVIGDIFDYTADPYDVDARPLWTSRYSRLIRFWNILVAFSCCLRIFLDPFFLVLIQVQVQEGKNCIMIDPVAPYLIYAKLVAVFIFVAHIIIKLCMAAREVPKNQYLRKLKLIQNQLTYDLITAVPSLLIWAYYKPLVSVWLYVVVFSLYYSRLAKLIQQFHSGGCIKSDWAKIVINILFFIFVGQLVGSVWYIFGVQRVTECIGDVCGNLNISASACMVCHGSKSNPIRELIANENPIRELIANESVETCFQEDEFRYGIFLKVVNLTKYGFFTRCSYSVLWGFQQIITLTRYLVPSYFLEEIFLVMLIMVVGFVSFGLFVNNLAQGSDNEEENEFRTMPTEMPIEEKSEV